MVERAGWRFSLLADALTLSTKTREELVEVALRAAQGMATQLTRRSRHATTYFERISGAPALKPFSARGDDGRMSAQAGGAQLDLFVKLFNPRTGLARLFRAKRQMRAFRVVQITDQLRARAFSTPSLLLLAQEPGSRRSLLIATRAEGELLPTAMSKAAVDSPARKWALLRALGGEVARLHCAGFVHGDLTPYNVLVVGDAPGRFVLLDHDRTFLPRFWRRRRQLRNLVQLGCPQFGFLSRTDRLRFFRAYAKARGVRADPLMLRRVNAMLTARRRRDLRRLALSART